MPRRSRSDRPQRRPLGDRALSRLTDPLDELLGDSTPEVAPDTDRPEAPPPPATAAPRLRLSTEIGAQVLDRAKDAVFWTPGQTLAAFVEEALSREVARRTDERGEPFPRRTSPLPPGHPVR
jgi:hypothetical protein